jgi:serine/threonine protein kinase
MKLTDDQIRQLSEKLDDVMSLPKSDWQPWIAANAGTGDPVHEKLRALAVGGFLEKTFALIEKQDMENMSGLLVPPAQTGADINAVIGARIGPYELVELISQGGMGSVWLADRADGAYQRRVALKLPFVGKHAALLAKRFEVERDILALLEHPNIARFYDAGVDQATPFFALEYVPGQPITEFCRDKNLSLNARLDLMLQVLSAVGHAHSHLVIHRDLKPNNVLVSEAGQVKLLDFGISKLLSHSEMRGSNQRLRDVSPENAAAENNHNERIDRTDASDLTRAHGHAMTPRYASPEQLFSEPITTASDIYSFGVLLYTVLAGRSPYGETLNSIRAVRDVMTNGSIAPMNRASDDSSKSSNNPSPRIPHDLEAIVRKALARKSSERYQSANELADDIARYRARTPVRARARTPAYVAERFLRRNWIATTALVAGIAGVSTFAGIIYFESERLRATKAFLLEALTPTSYYNDGGGLFTHREMLNRAVAGIPARFSQEPEIAGELYAAIGESQFNLGEHEDALQTRLKAQPLIDAAHGRTSRESYRNAARATYLYLTQRRFTEFQPALADLRTRCPYRDGVPQDHCYSIERIQSQYWSEVGETRLAVARWNELDRTVTPNVPTQDPWHVQLNYWSSGVARSAGDLELSKRRWMGLLTQDSVSKKPLGQHMYGLAIARILNDAGLQTEAATLAQNMYDQGVQFMGDAFDPMLFYIPGVAESHVAAGIDKNAIANAESLLRKGIAMIEARNGATDESGLQQSAHTRAALGNALLAMGEYDDAIRWLTEARNLFNSRPIKHSESAHKAVLQLATIKAIKSDLYGAISDIVVSRKSAESEGDQIGLMRADALLSVLDANRAEADKRWIQVNAWMLRTGSRLPDIQLLFRLLQVQDKFGAARAFPPPQNDTAIQAIRDYARNILDTTQVAMQRRAERR